MRIPYDTLAADGMKALGGVYAYISRCGLEKSLVDLAYLRASQINGCAYCVAAHSHDLLKAGVSAEKLLLLPAWHEAGSVFTERERAVLAWTESVTLVAKTRVPDEAFVAVRAAPTDQEIADLTIAIGLINAYNRMAIAFRREPAVTAAEAGQ
ncbi:carboxymuconolactone decarboxylase family protein [Sphingomonas koreensis]|nr:carboxymuconolactone decarboxylase family protein [Sphingomonas koreensis]